MRAYRFSAEVPERAAPTEPQGERSAEQSPSRDALVPCPAWRDPGVSHHSMQIYEEDTHLLDAVRHFTGTGLAAGEAAIVIATPSHRDQLEAHLRAHGVDVATAHAQGQYVPLDAAETLAQCMVDGAPEARRFVDVVGGVIARVGGQYTRVRVFGEMGELLWSRGLISATLRSEAIWN